MSLPTVGRPSVQDASLKVSIALPAAASTTVNTAAIDLGALTSKGMRSEHCELFAAIPLIVLAKLPNTSVETYTIQASDSATFASGVKTLAQTTQTGATGSASQPAQDLRCRLPSDCPRYARLQVVSDAAGANASSLSASLQIVV